MKTLQQIAEERGTDKAEHGYCEIYAKRMEHLRDQPIKLLELGVFYGASLAMWRDYFPNGEIHGVDLDCERCDGVAGVTLHKFDVSDRRLLEELTAKHGPWDIIVDDASHTMKHQQRTFDIMWPSIKPGGLFIIEDLHTSFMPKLDQYSADLPTDLYHKTTYKMVENLKEGKEFFSKYISKEAHAQHIAETEHVTIWVKKPAQFSYELTSDGNSATSIIRKKKA